MNEQQQGEKQSATEQEQQKEDNSSSATETEKGAEDSGSSEEWKRCAEALRVRIFKALQRAYEVVRKPNQIWEVIKSEQLDATAIYRDYLLILVAIPAVFNLLGRFVVTTYGAGSALLGSIVFYCIALAAIYVAAVIIEMIAPRLEATVERSNALRLVAYSFTPAYLAGFLLLFPQLRIVAGLVSLASFFIMKLGLSHMTSVDQTQEPKFAGAVVGSSFLVFLIVAFVATRI